MQPVVPLPTIQQSGSPADEPAASSKDAVRIQSAAIAAQQVVLTLDEIKLGERRAALQEHEEQLARHLEEKRQELVALSERVEAERAALDKERAATNDHVEQVTRQLDERAGQVNDGEHNLAQRLLSFHTEYELGRRQLRDAWERLRNDQLQWKRRRSQERAALKVRRRDCEAAEGRLVQAQRGLEKEKRDRESTLVALQMEDASLQARVSNQRAKIEVQQAEIARLNADILTRRRERAGLGGPAVLTLPGPDSMNQQVAAEPQVTGAEVPVAEKSRDGSADNRHVDLDFLAGELADQRLQLAEQWRWLGGLRAQWEAECRQAAGALEALASRLANHTALLGQREQNAAQADQVLRHRHDELVRMRRQLIAWRARLSVREVAWDGARRRWLAELQSREMMMDRHFGGLVELRRRWIQLRRVEIEKLRAEHAALAALRREKNGIIRADTAEEIEQHSAALLSKLEGRFARLEEQANGLAQEEVEFIEKQTSWEHKQTLAAAQHSRIQHEMQTLRGQRKLFEQQIARMKDEIERIARALIDEPDPPISEALTSAA